MRLGHQGSMAAAKSIEHGLVVDAELACLRPYLVGERRHTHRAWSTAYSVPALPESRQARAQQQDVAALFSSD